MSSWCCLIYKVLWFCAVIEAFLTRSLERLFIIPRRISFVNTFFQKNSIFLKFSELYSFQNFFSGKIDIINTFRYETGTFSPISQVLFLEITSPKYTSFSFSVKNFRFGEWIFIITHRLQNCKTFLLSPFHKQIQRHLSQPGSLRADVCSPYGA